MMKTTNKICMLNQLSNGGLSPKKSLLVSVKTVPFHFAVTQKKRNNNAYQRRVLEVEHSDFITVSTLFNIFLHKIEITEAEGKPLRPQPKASS